MSEEREELVAGLLELADQVEAIRPPASRRAQWEWEPPALTPTELRRVAELLEDSARLDREIAAADARLDAEKERQR